MSFKVLIAAGLLALVTGVGGYTYWQQQLASRLPDGLVAGNGRLEAVQVDVSTKIGGRVKEVIVQEGDLVRPDQIVARIDTAQLRAQLLRAQADVASAESQVAAAEAAIAQANAQHILAEQELERARILLRKGHTTKELYDTRVSQSDVARANVEATQASLVARHRGVDAARAVAQEIETQINDSVLKSPIIGRVLYRLAEPGEVLGNGGKVLTLINLTDVYMEIFLPSAEAHLVSVGNEARIKFDVLDFAVPARVSFISPQSQFTPKQVETRSERDKLMFRIKVRVPSQLIKQYIDRVVIGVRGVAYVQLDGDVKPAWPDDLQKLPPGAAQLLSAK